MSDDLGGGALDDADDAFDSDLLQELNEIWPDDPRRHLPTRLVLDGPPVPTWSPPELTFELEMEHLLGDPALELLPDPTEPGICSIDQGIRRLPARLRRAIQSVRTTWHRESLLHLVEAEAEARAPQTQFRELEVPDEPCTQWYLPEIHRRRALEVLAADTVFLERLRLSIATTIEQGHMQRLFAGWPRPLPILPSCSIPTQSPWRPESWLGLALSAMPEAAPEEVLVALAQRAWRRLAKPAGRRHRARGCVLSWGALHSTFALALMATAPVENWIAIDEVDTVGQPQAVPWVRARTTALPNGEVYDLAFVHLPPPGEDANNLRNRYKDQPNPTGGEVHLHDIGRLGARKWRRRARTLLKDVITRVKANGEIALLVPTAIRVVNRSGPYPQWGYAARPELADGVRDVLREVGWVVSDDIDVVEINPFPQPFFHSRRCTWRLMLAKPPIAEPAGAAQVVQEVGLSID